MTHARPFAVVLLCASLCFSGSLYLRAQAPTPARGQDAAAAAAHQGLVTKYCVTCHNQRAKTGGLTLDDVDIARIGDHAETWEKVVQKLRAGLMPPGGMPRPDPAASDRLVSYLETSLDRAALERPNPGRTEALHRLNRSEYRNAVRDLLSLDIDVSTMLPADDVSYGFDNIAGVQRMSPTLMERYLGAAQKVAGIAVGASAWTPTTETFLVPPELRQDDRLDGLPFGTRGGVALQHTFPRDGEYRIRVQLARSAGASFDDIPTFDEVQRLELSVDGEPAHVFELRPEAARGAGNPQGVDRRALDADWHTRVQTTAGPHTVTLAFLNRTPALLENLLEPFQKPVPGGPNGYYTTQKGAYLRRVEISGPYGATGSRDTPSRQAIFRCHPPSPSGLRRDESATPVGLRRDESATASGLRRVEPTSPVGLRRDESAAPAAEDTCATQILSALARRAFRRPVAPDDLQTLLASYHEGRAAGGFEAGVERAVETLLVSPEFLFRVEREPAAPAPGSATYPIGALDLASRLSFFLWSSIPDDALLQSAESGRLSQPAELERQVRRMLADPKADALVRNFVGQWLFLRNLPTVLPDPQKDPDFDEDLRQGFRRETELFAGSIFREDRSALDLLTADYTYVNERLARHYGIPNVQGTHFRRVTLTDGRRRGLLGQGSVLSVTSFPHRTSPVVRGKFVLENLLGTPPPPPPPNVPALRERQNTSEDTLSMRDRIAQHRASPACASCHSLMDPLGLSLENFDLAGRWRTVDEALVPIDASGVLPDGTKFDGPAGLRGVLMRHPDRFVRTLTEKLMTYALGRGLEYYDMPAVRAIVRDAARHDYRTSSLVLGVVTSLPFQNRRREP